MQWQNGMTWEQYEAGAAVENTEANTRALQKMLVSQIETSSKLADRVVKLEVALNLVADLTGCWGHEDILQVHEIARKALEGGLGETPAS